MKIKYQIIITFTAMLIICFACDKKEKTKKIPVTILKKNDNKLTFDNFLFFKKKATSEEILTLLNMKKINHSSILSNTNSNVTGLTTLKIKSLKIINQVVPLVEITFVNNILAKLKFSSANNFNESYSDRFLERVKKQINSLNSNITQDNLIYEELFQALKDKYGIPPNAKYNDSDGGYEGVVFYTFEPFDLTSNKTIYFNYELEWNSTQQIKMNLSRTFNCNGGKFENYTPTSIDLYYYSDYTVTFEEQLLKEAINKLNKLNESLREQDKKAKQEKRKQTLKDI